MTDTNSIRDGMEVIGSDGITVGNVDSVDGQRIKLMRKDSPDGDHHYVDAGDIARVDSHVHLSRSAASVLGAGAGAGATGAALHDRDRPVATSERRTNWLPWLLGGAALLALIAALSQCDDRDRAAEGTDPVAAETAAIAGAGYMSGTMAYDVDRYLAGTGAAPRSFAFQKLNFDSGKATIRDEDESDLDDIARVFTAYPQARAAIVGYTDADGPAAGNAELGAQRARAVIAALAARGVESSRFEARTGGESNPEASNASGAGKSENRRTELIVLNR